MNKGELVAAVTDKLYAENRRKTVRVQKHTFYISDSDGNSSSFTVDRKENEVAFNRKDISMILDAFMDVIEEEIRAGGDVSLSGFGSLFTHYRAARKTKYPGTDEWVDVEARLVPKFSFGSRLRMAARAAELIKKDADNAPQLPDPEYEFGEEE